MEKTERIVDVMAWHNPTFCECGVDCRIIRNHKSILQSVRYENLTKSSIDRIDRIMHKNKIYSAYISPTHSSMMFAVKK